MELIDWVITLTFLCGFLGIMLIVKNHQVKKERNFNKRKDAEMTVNRKGVVSANNRQDRA